MSQPETDCLFCKIVTGEIPAPRVWESDSCIAFNDIAPQAPTHVLVIPRNHTTQLATTLEASDLGGWMSAIQQVAAHLSLKDYRVVINNGVEAGQSVFHLHAHILAGRPLLWPPG